MKIIKHKFKILIFYLNFMNIIYHHLDQLNFIFLILKNNLFIILIIFITNTHLYYFPLLINIYYYIINYK